jgi:hypothetical protein
MTDSTLRTLRCPHCGAAPGSRCMTAKGWPMSSVHTPRIVAEIRKTAAEMSDSEAARIMTDLADQLERLELKP